jgi:hypothetical protein
MTFWIEIPGFQIKPVIQPTPYFMYAAFQSDGHIAGFQNPPVGIMCNQSPPLLPTQKVITSE